MIVCLYHPLTPITPFPADEKQFACHHTNRTLSNRLINEFVIVIFRLFLWFVLVCLVLANRRSSIGTFIRPNSSDGTQPKPVKAQPKLDYRSMISMDDMPDLFVSVDSKYLLHFNCIYFISHTSTQMTTILWENTFDLSLIRRGTVFIRRFHCPCLTFIRIDKTKCTHWNRQQ